MITPAVLLVLGTFGLIYSTTRMNHPSHRECTSLKCRWYVAANGFNLLGFSSGSWLLLAYASPAI